jgi:phosphoglycolate phosphatase-like HAD superfamily hydrolase
MSHLFPRAVYQGIETVITSLGHVPHGIVSQNAHSQISRALEAAGLLNHFRYIVGYEEVDLRKQKPEPDGLLLCIEKLTRSAPGVVFYIGDHETDIETAANANRALRQDGSPIQVITIAAQYGGTTGAHEWAQKPDYVATVPLEIIGIVQSFTSNT